MYYVNNEQILNNCIQEIKEQMPVEVVIRKKKRSLDQNAYYWKLLEILSPETGYDKEELHDKFRLMFLKTKVMQVEGKIYELPTSTTKLNTKEFTEYLDKIMLVASTMGISLPTKEYYGYP